MFSTEPIRLQAVIAGESGHYGVYVPECTLRKDDDCWASPSVSEMGAAPGWITYDLEGPFSVTRIGFRGHIVKNCPRDVILQSSEAPAGPFTDILAFTARMTRDL